MMWGTVLPAELLSILAGASGGVFLVNGRRTVRAVSIVLVVFLLVGVLVLGSRAALFSFVCGFLYLFQEIGDKRKRKRLGVFSFFSLIAVLLVLYSVRPASAMGRIYIWRVCLDMIKERPVAGYGWNGFIHNYMRYQATYLSSHPDTPFRFLADNVAFPYNEFLHMAASFGLIGVLVLSVFIWNILSAPKYTTKELILRSLLLNYLVFSFFSYPSDAFLTFLLFPGLVIVSPKRFLPRVTNIICIVITLFASVLFVKRDILSRDIRNMYGNSKEHVMEDLLSRNKANLSLFPEYKDLLLKGLSPEIQAEHFDMVLECARDCPNTESYCRAGDICALRGDYITALHYYDSAAEMVPLRIVPRYKAFCLLLEIGQRGEAQERGKEILSMDLKTRSSEAISLLNDIREKMMFL